MMCGKYAAFNMMQSLRALLSGEGVTVHAVVLEVSDPDITMPMCKEESR